MSKNIIKWTNLAVLFSLVSVPQRDANAVVCMLAAKICCAASWYHVGSYDSGARREWLIPELAEAARAAHPASLPENNQTQTHFYINRFLTPDQARLTYHVTATSWGPDLNFSDGCRSRTEVRSPIRLEVVDDMVTGDVWATYNFINKKHPQGTNCLVCIIFH